MKERVSGRSSPAPLLDLPLNHGEEPPFLRPRSRARPRRARRGTLGRVILAVEAAGGVVVAAFLLWAGYTRVMASERLKVKRVDVRGGRFLSEGEVRELLGPAVGENILSLDIDGLKARLRASPWVADATVRRNLPDTLTVEIRERVPLALAEVERLYLMDGDGALVDLYGPPTAGFDLPIVRGLAGVDADARRDRAQRAGALLRDLDDLAVEISEVHAEEGGDLKVVLRGAGEVLLMGSPPYRKRLLAFMGLRKELAERCPDAEYFDLRFRDRIYAKHTEREGPPPTAPAASPEPAKEGTAMPAAEPSPKGPETRVEWPASTTTSSQAAPVAPTGSESRGLGGGMRE